MWLIDVQTYELEYFHDETQVTYAILSHRWEEQEVSFKDMTERRRPFEVRAKKGWYKIQKCCKQAAAHSLRFAWVDTCCIDKSSSAELQEAINSMFRWYRQAKICYAFLSDVSISTPQHEMPRTANSEPPSGTLFGGSQWFSRGWTLQELVAPSNLVFYDRLWIEIGSRFKMALQISLRTGIPREILGKGFAPHNSACIAQIMSWAAGRETTRLGDRAYSLLGLFGVSLAMLYGEGKMAFVRLQEEILRRSDDQSILAWTASQRGNLPLLADSPDRFTPFNGSFRFAKPSAFPRRKAHLITNEGMSVELLLFPQEPQLYIAVLNSSVTQANEEAQSTYYRLVGIYLKRVDEAGRYVRWAPGDSEACRLPMLIDLNPLAVAKFKQITIVGQLKDAEYRHLMVGESSPLALRLQQRPSCSLDCIAKGIDICSSNTSDISSALYDPATGVIACQEPRAVLAKILPRRVNAAGIWHPIRLKSIAIGLDFDYKLVVIVSYVGAKSTPDDALLKEMTSYSRGFYNRDSEQVSDWDVFMINGLWRFWEGHLCLRMACGAHQAGNGLDAWLESKWLQNMRFRMSIRMNRPTRTEPWSLQIYVDEVDGTASADI